MSSALLRACTWSALALALTSCGREATERGAPAAASRSTRARDAVAALQAKQVTNDPRFSLAREAATVFVGHDVSLASLRFDGKGAHLGGGTASLDLHLARFGREGTLAAVDAASPVPAAAQNRVSYQHGPIEEWYQNGPAGLEQGFEVATRPNGNGPLILELAVSGLRAESDGVEVTFRDRDGVAATMRDLVALDADQRDIPARFAVVDGAVRVVLDDVGARYPLSIDPIIGIANALKATDTLTQNGLYGLAVKARGDRVIVGASRYPVSGLANAGAAYIYVRSGTSWVPEGKLTAPSPVASDEFATDVDIDNDTAVASAWKNNAQRGAVWVFKRVGSVWSHSATLTITGALGGLGFGRAIALDGTTLVATTQTTQKKFMVFTSLAAGAVPATTITSADATLLNWGTSVALQGGNIAIGCPDFSATASAVPMYAGSGGSWSLVNTVKRAGKGFGARVDVDGTAMIASGNDDANTVRAGYVYRKGATWTYEATLSPSFVTNMTYAPTVSISGAVAIVGGGEGPTAGATAAAMVFKNTTGATWSEVGKLTTVGGITAPTFASVSIDGDTAIAGASGANVDTVIGAGAAFVFHPVAAWPNGHACIDANQCSTGLCVDGVCCDTTCTDACKACTVSGSVGTCTAVPAGAPVGTRTCTPAKVCAAGGVCSSQCATTTDCTAGFYCGAGTCSPKKDPGAGCGGADQCKSGFCADGVCCNSACTGQCEACDVSGNNGTCTPVLGAARASKTACAGATTGADADCRATCNGVDATACHYPAATAACGADACTAGVESKVGLCNGSGTCSATTRLCSPFACDAAACKVSCATRTDCAAGFSCKGAVCVPSDSLGATCATAADCLDGLFCTDGVCCGVADCGADKSCAAKATAKGSCFAKQGASCTNALSCASGFCVDGVCCDAKCDGQCEACDASGDGTCGPVTGAPHGARSACAAGTGVCSATSCDGKNRTSCAGYKAGPAVVCRPAECDGDGVRPESTCDGMGTCATPSSSSCGKYKCDTSTSVCRTTCATTDDCAAGFSCNGGVCSTGATCSPDNLSSIQADGTKSCAPYLCGGDGDCRTSCTSSADCAPDTACDPALKTCVATSSVADVPQEESGGCALPSRSSRGTSGVALLVAALWAAGTVARRRSARR